MNDDSHRPESIAVLMEKATGILGIERKLAECKARLAWSEVVGPALSRHSTAIGFSNGRLVVSVPSAVWRNQLVYLKKGIVDQLNERAGMPVISDIFVKNTLSEKGAN